MIYISLPKTVKSFNSSSNFTRPTMSEINSTVKQFFTTFRSNIIGLDYVDMMRFCKEKLPQYDYLQVLNILENEGNVFKIKTIETGYRIIEWRKDLLNPPCFDPIIDKNKKTTEKERKNREETRAIAARKEKREREEKRGYQPTGKNNSGKNDSKMSDLSRENLLEERCLSLQKKNEELEEKIKKREEFHRDIYKLQTLRERDLYKKIEEMEKQLEKKEKTNKEYIEFAKGLVARGNLYEQELVDLTHIFLNRPWERPSVKGTAIPEIKFKKLPEPSDEETLKAIEKKGTSYSKSLQIAALLTEKKSVEAKLDEMRQEIKKLQEEFDQYKWGS